MHETGQKSQGQKSQGGRFRSYSTYRSVEVELDGKYQAGEVNGGIFQPHVDNRREGKPPRLMGFFCRYAVSQPFRHRLLEIFDVLFWDVFWSFVYIH